MELLTADKLALLNGKTVKWKAPAYKLNKPYSGIDTILEVNENDRNPLKTQVVEGDNLSFAFQDKYTDGFVAYSDSDRIISFEIIPDEGTQ